MKIENNTILITGGTSGFGLEFTKRFLKLGNTVIITGRDRSKLDEIKEIFPEVHTFQSDVSDPLAIKELFEKVTTEFPELNILINNAGVMRRIALHGDYDLNDITREIEINLMGPIRMVQQFLPHLKMKRAATILNVTSWIALMTFPISPIYSASKSGLHSYTQALRVQLKHTNIKVIELVAPVSSTPLNDKFKLKNDFKPNSRILMAPEKIIDAAIKGMKNEEDEVFPGAAKIMRILSRIAPRLLLSQTGKIGASIMHEK